MRETGATASSFHALLFTRHVPQSGIRPKLQHTRMSDTNAPTIFLAGGGTGGHLYPGIAVAEALRQQIPGVKPVFLVTNREIDRVILQPTGFEFIPQPILPLPSVTAVGWL